MPEIRMRPKHQITLPASIVRAAKLKTDDRMTVDFINGVIIIDVKPDQASTKSDLMSFAGIGQELWGSTPEEINNNIRSLRDSWNR